MKEETKTNFVYSYVGIYVKKKIPKNKKNKTATIGLQAGHTKQGQLQDTAA